MNRHYLLLYTRNLDCERKHVCLPSDFNVFTLTLRFQVEPGGCRGVRWGVEEVSEGRGPAGKRKGELIGAD